MKKLLLLALCLAAAVCSHAQDELYYGKYRGSGTLKGIGTSKVESYDVAIHLDDPTLVGMEIRGLRIPVNTSAKDVTDYKAWLSSELTVSSGKNVADIASVDFTPDSRWVDVTFETPYTITADGVYAGYSFTVNSLSSTTDAAATPVMGISGTDIDGLYIRTSRSYRKWIPFDESLISGQGTFAFVVRLGGDRIKQHAATLLPPSDLDAYAYVGKAYTATITLVNHGCADIKNIDYAIELDGQRVERHINVSVKGTYYGQQGTFKAAIPVVETRGTRPIDIRLLKINGEDNEDDNPTATMNLAFLAETPQHKPLLEEYTGTWCGWCPRGMVALEAMTELYGDDFVCVAWHNGDPMQITEIYPNLVSGYPHAFLDRIVTGYDEQQAEKGYDPFYGSSSGTSLGIQNDWKRRQAVLAPAAIDLQANWTDESQTAVQVTTDVTFIRDFDNSPYRLTYILVADDLQGSTGSWAQVNYFSGGTSYASDRYLSPLAKMEGKVRMHFNDVAIQASNYGKAAISESLPAVISEYEPYRHRYTFDISSNSLAQDKTKLHVVAALVDTSTGEVVNAEKAAVSGTDAIRSTQAKEIVGMSYVDISGRRVSPDRNGIYIQTVTYSDGSRHSTKISK